MPFAPTTTPVKARALLLYTIGYPGSGKTTFAKNIAQHVGMTHLYADRVAFELFRIPKYTPEEAQILYGTMDERAEANLGRGRSTLYDAAANNRAMRDRLRKLARRNGAEAIGVWLRVPAETAKARSGAMRPSEFIADCFRTIPGPLFMRYLAAFEPPQSDEPIVTISGATNFDEQLRVLKRGLANLKSARVKLPHRPIGAGFEFTY